MAGVSKAVRESRSPLCSVEGCEDDRFKLDYCQDHYKIHWLNGDPLARKYRRRHCDKNAAYRKEYVRAYLLEHGCMDCGYDKDARALSFDHRPGTVKVRDIKAGQQFGWDALLEEIAKCDVVCMNCHVIRTSERRIGGEK